MESTRLRSNHWRCPGSPMGSDSVADPLEGCEDEFVIDERGCEKSLEVSVGQLDVLSDIMD